MAMRMNEYNTAAVQIAIISCVREVIIGSVHYQIIYVLAFTRPMT